MSLFFRLLPYIHFHITTGNLLIAFGGSHGFVGLRPSRNDVIASEAKQSQYLNSRFLIFNYENQTLYHTIFHSA